MHVSTAFCMTLMLAFAVYNCFYLTLFLKEHHLPLMFRSPNISFAYDLMRAKIIMFCIFLTLAGVQAQLNLYSLTSPCLYTDVRNFTAEWVDTYQYGLTTMFWVIAVPGISLAICTIMRDEMRLGCYPIIISMIVIGLMLWVLS